MSWLDHSISRIYPSPACAAHANANNLIFRANMTIREGTASAKIFMGIP